MTQRALLGLGALFAASLALFYLLQGDRPGVRAVAMRAESRSGELRPALSDGTSQLESAPVGASKPAAGEAAPDFEAARDAALSAPEADDRIRALQVLGDAPTTMAVDILVGASRDGTDYQERAMAVTSLRRLAQRGETDGRIRYALQTALSDPSPIVAVLAQSALDTLDPQP